MHSPTTPTALRVSGRTIALIGALLLALGSGLALAAAATASGSRRSRAAAHRSVPCTKGSSAAKTQPARRKSAGAQRGRSTQSCTKGAIGNSRRRVAPPANGPIVVTSPLAPASSSPLPAAGTPEERAGKSRPKSGGSSPSEAGKAERLPEETNGVLTDPIDPRYLTEAPFGTSSFWLQPWRAYLDTWPASTLTSSLGINFNVGPTQAEAVAQLLQDSGFKLARREIPWSALSYEDPTKFSNEARLNTILGALHKHGLRPLILLNANSGQPGPARQVSLTTLAPASAGARTVQLDQASAAVVVPGKTGFDGLTFGTGPDVLVTAVSPTGVATLSRPLREALAAGKHRATTLRYAPFQNPTLANGQPNPVFRETLDGWLSYVATVSREAASVFGPEGYDLEVWNELSFGSQFLNYEHYYQQGEEASGVQAPGAQAAAVQDEELSETEEDAETEESPQSRENSQALEVSEAESPEAQQAAAQPAAQAGAKTSISKSVSKEIRRLLLKETIAYVRNPANGIPPGVGVTDGFASQTPFPSGADQAGLTALSKHLYSGAKTYPAAYPNNSIRPINALGFRDTESESRFTPLFVPSYQSLLPEAYLTANHTETLVRDIAPITTQVYGQPHGRNVGPAGGNPVQKWMTEYNLSPGKGTPMEADGVTPAHVTLSSADRAHFQAKALLRSLVAMVNKGVAREYFFAAAPGALSLIGKGFYTALETNPETYPGDALGGETMSGFRNMLAQFQGPGPGGSARQVKLLSIAQEGNHAQFAGDGTAAHPNLYDRDVLAVLPFQSSPTRFVIPVYVMTQDLLTLYEPNQPAGDVNRFDLPDETFRVKLGGLPATSNPPAVSAYDPLRGQSTPAKLLSREGETAEFEIVASDYPRMLTLDYSGE